MSQVRRRKTCIKLVEIRRKLEGDKDIRLYCSAYFERGASEITSAAVSYTSSTRLRALIAKDMTFP